MSNNITEVIYLLIEVIIRGKGIMNAAAVRDKTGRIKPDLTQVYHQSTKKPIKWTKS